jgi:hypothetical protein
MPTDDYRWNHVQEAHERHSYTVPVYDSSARSEFVVETASGRRNVTGRQLVNEQRANLIAQAMDTPEGRRALTRSLDYQGIGRQLLMVDELPQGAYATYERAIYATVDEMVAAECEQTLYAWLAFYYGYKEEVMMEEIAKERFNNAIDQLDV